MMDIEYNLSDSSTTIWFNQLRLIIVFDPYRMTIAKEDDVHVIGKYRRVPFHNPSVKDGTYRKCIIERFGMIFPPSKEHLLDCRRWYRYNDDLDIILAIIAYSDIRYQHALMEIEREARAYKEANG